MDRDAYPLSPRITRGCTLNARPGRRLLEAAKPLGPLVGSAVVWGREAVVSKLGYDVVFPRINAVPCLRERPEVVPSAPALLLARLRSLWSLRNWTAEFDDGEVRDSLLTRRHASVISQIESHVAERFDECEDIPLPEYDWENGDPDEFYELFVATPMPVVLRGFTHRSTAGRTWDFDWILERCGDVDVTLTGPDADWTGPLREVRNPDVYCANADAPFKAHPELVDDLSIPDLEPYLRRDYRFSQFFVGKQGTGSGYHCAGIWNMFHMIDGRKKWWFVDPEFSWMIYPSIPAGLIAYASLVAFPERSDPTIYPLYRRCPRYTTTLEAGDVLLNPPWWWHAIENESPKSVGVATRWDAMRRDRTFHDANRALSTLAVVSPRFPSQLGRLLDQGEDARKLMTRGPGALEGEEPTARDQDGRNQNSYVGVVARKIRAGAKW